MRAQASKKKAGGRGGAQPGRSPFANGSNTRRNINLFIVIVVVEEVVVVVVVEEGIVIRTWVEPGLNLGSNLGSNPLLLLLFLLLLLILLLLLLLL